MSSDPSAIPGPLPRSTAAGAGARGEAGSVAEKPRNGLAGLKYWRYDVGSGLLVSLISLPFSLGIAIASGAPPVCGLTSAIIAGLVFPFVGGSYMTIAGPAAGLAPVLLAAMTALGRGDLAAGYPLLLVVICLTGAVQVALSLAKAARFAAIFPSAVVEGMLAAIGLMIIAKELPHFLGHPFHAHDFFGYLRELPGQMLVLNPRVTITASLCLALIFALTAVKARWLKVVPPQVIAVVFGGVVAYAIGLRGGDLLSIPNGLRIVTPDFSGLFADRGLWLTAIVALVTLTMVDGVESLATASAIDKIDPFHRKSEPNRVLLAMGISNILSSIAGGLTIIPGGVKSKANIEGGGRTLWANFYNACFLLFFLYVASSLINKIPYAALSAVLMHIGFKLCRPKVWAHVASIGREQLLVFAITVVVTLATDLLVGIAAGILAKLLLTLGLTAAASTPGRRDLGAFRRLATLFRSPVRGRALVGGVYHLSFAGPLVSFNALPVNEALGAAPGDSSEVVLHLDEDVTLVDHTSCENLLHFAEEYERNGRGHVRFEGMDHMKAKAHDYAPLHLAASGLLPRHPLSWVGRLLSRATARLAPPRPPGPASAADRALLDHLAFQDRDPSSSPADDLRWASLSAAEAPKGRWDELDKHSLSDPDAPRL